MFAFCPVADASVQIPEIKPGAPNAPADANAYAALLVIDERSGETLYEHQASKRWPAASLTKLMTAIVFTSTPTNWSASGNIIAADEVGGGRLRVPSGSVMSLRDLLSATIVGSANNTAQALARLFDGRGVNAFVQHMNRTAPLLGLHRTSFYDASGMNPKNTTSAYDIATMLVEASMESETQRAMVTPYYRFAMRSPALEKTIKNTNNLLFYEPDVIVTAGKTGYLHESQYNYAVRLRPKGDQLKSLVVVVLGAATRQDSIDTSVSLARWAWSAYEWKTKTTYGGITLSRNWQGGQGGGEVRKLQEFLNANNYTVATVGPGSPGQETSYFGALTKAAVKRFQEAHRDAILAPKGATEGSGYIDFLTRAAIHAYDPASVADEISSRRVSASTLPPMGPGTVGSAVRTLQELLARETDVYPEALVTGYYGPLTRRAVQRFQMKHGVVSSAGEPGYGYVGPKTRAKFAAMYGT